MSFKVGAENQGDRTRFRDYGQAYAVKSRSTATGQRNDSDRMMVPDVRPNSSLKLQTLSDATDYYF